MFMKQSIHKNKNRKAKPSYRLIKEKYLSTKELSALNDTLCKYPGRDSLLIQLALATGARATELLNITRADLHHGDCSVTIHGIKGSDDRDIPLSAKLFGQLAHYAESHHHQRVFPISYSMLRKIWYNYRPVKKKFHSLRHTFAINLYRKCKDIRLLQVALGHRNWNNTMIYAQYQYRNAELREAIFGQSA